MPAGGFDAVVIAGDVQVPLVRSLEWIAERFHGVPVVYVPGNHDFWWDRGEVRYTLSDQVRLGRAAADRLGVHLLMDDAVTIGGVTFVGATLWTDFRLGAFGLLHGLRSAGGREGMQDYRRIRTGPTSRHRIEPEDVLRLHRASRAYVQGAIRPAPERTVVVTHHAPSRRSLSPHENLAWCYATDLDDLIGTCRPALWVHGHVHRHADYRIHDTRIVCNPRGHVEEATGFIPGLVVEVPDRQADADTQPRTNGTEGTN
ncbi:Icc-related predicted phosphoesterase [Methylobacterium brachiatum]|uniref:Icc-related predicted phosphoesterase n=1 Tax=Methylobacterium brachiatum TaxID=269660 RepID=A0AAJ1WWQ1_9HYPH|nr:Icc-related predicted phosphoesterase [Methylobacterium brachiatum]